MAAFCVATGYSKDEYLALTLAEREAMTRILNRRRRG